MKIVELTDYTMVIQREGQKDNNKNFHEIQKRIGSRVKVFTRGELEYVFNIIEAKEAIFSPDIIVLYFSEKIPEDYKVGTKVGIEMGRIWYI